MIPDRNQVNYNEEDDYEAMREEMHRMKEDYDLMNQRFLQMKE